MNANRLTETLLDLLAIPSPSGFTDEIVRYVGRQLDEIGLPYDVTRRGTIRAKLAGSGDGPVRAVVNHLDTIGAMVRLIRADGRILLAPVGYWSARFAEGTRVTLFAERGAFRGTLLPQVEWGVSRDAGVEGVPIDWDHIELRLDEAIFDADGVRALGIEVGDFVVTDPNPEILDNGFIVARHLDNKAGAAVVLESLRTLQEQAVTPTRDTYFLFTITESVGFGSGSAVLPEVSELLTVDFASVPPQEKSPLRRVTIAAADASGPYDYHFIANLQRIAERENIPCYKKLLAAYHSDTASALAAGHDVRTAVIAYAGDASHSMERTHIDSLTNLGRLVIAYLTTEPTFEQDAPVVSVESFPRQITEENLPPAHRQAPESRDVIQRDFPGARHRADEQPDHDS